VTGRVTPQLHDEIVRRDGCFAYSVDRKHVCKDQWGRSHGPRDYAKLTVDHVHDQAMMGKRAPSDSRHLIGMCWAGNVLGWASAHRSEEREYLAGLA
jgi:hypothetical protein